MRRIDASVFAMISVVVAALFSVGAAKVPQRPGARALEEAAADLAGGRLDAARAGFRKVSVDKTAAEYERSLALLGLAETALARKDAAGAAAAWKQLAGDVAMPPVHRDVARRKIARAERVRKGLAPDDPAEHRAKLPTLPARAAVLHVAPEGKPGGDGAAARPLTSLTAARDAIRAMKKARGGKLPPGGVRVMVRGGVYPVTETFALTAEDSGTAEAPIVYQAAAGQSPVFDGGIRISRWRPISDAKLRAQLAPAVRARVVEASLKALGVVDLGDATALRKRPELYCSGMPQTLARWPNTGFVKTGKILDKRGRFQYVEDRPGTWRDEPDVRLYGYWGREWYEEYQKVAQIDATARSFTLAPPYSRYGYRANRRYRAENVFRELDSPGEWYLDRRTATVYWLGPKGIEPARAPTRLSLLAKPFVSMQDVRHVVLLGLTFQDARGDGVHVKGGGDCLIAGCTLRRLGGDAITVSGGKRHGIFGCTMHPHAPASQRVHAGARR